MVDTLRAARAAYARRDWAGAREAFRTARDSGELTADDLYAWGDAAWWLGQLDDSIRANQDAYHRYLAGDQHRPAAMAAMTVAINLLLRGDEALGSGWLSRARRLLAGDPDSAESGLLRYFLEVETVLDSADTLPDPEAEALLAAARQVRDLGERHRDAGLVGCGLIGEGRALVKRGRVREGLALLDEAMVVVDSEDVAPELAGNVYCHLMAAAHELADIRRARDWTAATGRWLAGLPAAVLFTGVCRVHRSQLHQLTGDWERAAQEAARAGVDLAGIQPSSAAEAYYQLGEVRRLRGELAGADEAYARAHRLGRDPQPGLALLRLAQGQPEIAAGSIRSALAAAPDRLSCARRYAAQVEIALAGDDLATARKASEELAGIARAFRGSGLAVLARQAHGAVLLAEGHPAEALPVLREACQRWHEVEAPYECARVQVLLARAYQELADPDAATRELTAAAATFERLGAVPDARAAAARLGRRDQWPDGLTGREVEVLGLVAIGRSNRQIATALVISEKTVARHLSNIFTKVGASSRTEAASYAYAHGLVPADHG